VNIIVCGWVAAFPTAGFLWHPLAFALGMQQLGHQVWFLEDSGNVPYCWDPDAGDVDPSGAAGSRFLAREMAAVGLSDRWVYRHIPSGRHDGMSAVETRDVLAAADVLINVSLTTEMRPEYLRVPIRIGIDTDPVFTQVRIAKGDQALAPVPSTHTRLFTYGSPPLPAQLHEWVPTRQPVALQHWPVAGPVAAAAPFTSVTTWQAYPPVVWEGETYAAKDVSLRALLDLPSLVEVPLLLALGAGSDHQAGAGLLSSRGWRLADPIAATRSTSAYQQWIAASAGEIGVAKHGYVAARSGWFSERTCLYLASGRPAVVQDTGWTDWLPEGNGLLAYRDLEGAAAAISRVLEAPAEHAAAARQLVEEHFDAAVVCQALLDAL
jgi:hypothetical protein